MNAEYIIWNPDGPTPPKARFDSRLEAQQAAERLAEKHPAQRFYVCQLVSVSETAAVHTQSLDGTVFGPPPSDFLAHRRR